jgi:hypothetical protein
MLHYFKNIFTFAFMTITKAITSLMASEDFKNAAKNDARLRVYLGRFRRGALGNCGSVELLLEFGYTIEVRKPMAKNK